MNNDNSDLKVGIAGLGLIGGSLAKAIKRAGYFVAGYDINESTIQAALQTGAVDTAAAKPSVLYDCEIIFVALYPAGIIEFVEENAPNFMPGSIVVDCCGIKGKICERLYKKSYPNFTFIGGHPMAGTEQNGFSASYACLFDGASFLLTPRPNENKGMLDTLKNLLLSAGFARVVVTTPKHHDRMIAFTSQLPHVLACSYVMSPSCPFHDGYSAGSYKDVSRVAHINPPLWSDLFIDNKDELCTEIDIMIRNMENIRDAVKSGDGKTLTALLQKARTLKDSCDAKTGSEF